MVDDLSCAAGRSAAERIGAIAAAPPAFERRADLAEDAGGGERSVWYLHTNAGGPGVGSYDRPYHLARYWRQAGVPAVVVTPSFHHLMDAEAIAPGQRRVDEASYYFTRAIRYAGNGPKRVVNMLQFTLNSVAESRAIASAYGRPAAVIASSPHPLTLLSALALRRLYGCKVIFEIRDLWPLSLIDLAGYTDRNLSVKAFGWIEGLACRKADFVVSLLGNAYDYLASRGLSADRFAWIPNGVTPASAVAGDPGELGATIARLKAQDRLVVIYAGTIGLANNVELLVETARLAEQAGDRRFAFVIVGDGVRRGEIVSRIASLGLSNVHVLGRMRKADLTAALPQADIGFISLVDKPLFAHGVSPNKMFDYMLAGLPVAFAIASPNNAVALSGGGLVVSPLTAEAVLQTLAELHAKGPQGRAEMGAMGRSYTLENHAYAELASRYIDVFRRCGAPLRLGPGGAKG